MQHKTNNFISYSSPSTPQAKETHILKTPNKIITNVKKLKMKSSQQALFNLTKGNMVKKDTIYKSYPTPPSTKKFDSNPCSARHIATAYTNKNTLSNTFGFFKPNMITLSGVNTFYNSQNQEELSPKFLLGTRYITSCQGSPRVLSALKQSTNLNYSEHLFQNSKLFESPKKGLKKIHKISLLDQMQNKIPRPTTEIETINRNNKEVELLNLDYCIENNGESLVLDSHKLLSTDHSSPNSLTQISCADLNIAKNPSLPTINEVTNKKRGFKSPANALTAASTPRSFRNNQKLVKAEKVTPKNIPKYSTNEKSLCFSSSVPNSPSGNARLSGFNSQEQKQPKIIENNDLKQEFHSKPQIASVKIVQSLPSDLHTSQSPKKVELMILELEKAASDKKKIEDRGRNCRAAFRSCLGKLKRLKLSFEEVINKSIFSQRPYQKKGSRQFIEAARVGNTSVVEKLLQEYGKYLVYDYDYIYQTALHFTAKRGWLKLADLLIKNGADVNAKDIAGRTPLFFAIKYNQLEMVRVLLGSCAEPWISEDLSYKKMALDNRVIYKLIIEAQIMHVLIGITSLKTRVRLWKRDNEIDILRWHFLA